MNKLFPLILILSILAGCSAPSPTPEGHEEHEEHTEDSSIKLDEAQVKTAGIETAPVALRNMQPSLDVPGTVASTTKGRAIVTPPVPGRLVTLTVQLGDSVRQGQVLGVIESTELAQAWTTIAESQRARDAVAAQLQDAQSQLELANAKLSAAKQSQVRQRQMVAAGAFNQAPVQQAQSDLNDLQSELLGVQKEQASHTEVVRRLENLYRDGIVSKSELEAARLELQQDEIRLNRVKSRVDLAKATYEREKNIAQRGLLNSRELQSAEAEVRATTVERDRATIALRSARAALANANRAIQNAQSSYRTHTGGARANVGRVNLVAPISGTITELTATHGQAVERTQSICEIEDLASVWVTANIPEKEATKIAKGAAVRITVPAFPDEQFQGIVQIVGGRLDPKTRAIPVQCLITGTRGRLKPEMFATVHIGHGPAQSILSVPETAIVDVNFVFVKEGDHFERREVQLGASNGGYIAIAAGLKAGEQIAVKGAFILQSEEKQDELKGHDH